jgi:hypothetical protein
MLTSVEKLARPFCNVIDATSSRLKFSPFYQSNSPRSSKELDLETHFKCLTTIPSKQLILPEYDLGSLEWTLKFISDRRVFGQLRKSLVLNSESKPVGWYVYGMTPGKIGEVLQIGAESASVGIVLTDLFRDAQEKGLIGLHGRMEPQFMQELTSKSCFFFRNGSWTLAHSSNLELLSLLSGGTAFFSRLDGEWSLRHGTGSGEVVT